MDPRRPIRCDSTPALAGVREMFRPQPLGPTATPRMDGIQDMLETPVGYRAPPPAQQRDEEDGGAEEQQDEDEPVEELPTRNPRAKKTPATRIARRTPVPQSAPSKSTRAASQAPEETGADEERAPRRTRARTADGAVGQVCIFIAFTRIWH